MRIFTLNRFARTLAFVTAASLAACNGGQSLNSTPVPVAPQSGSAILTNIVGVGDSLTAGEQASGLLGVPTTNPVSALPGNLVPPTQTNGWWALFYAQAKGIALSPGTYNIGTILGDPARSPLPLVNAPGIGSQLVVTAPPLPFTATHSPCDTFNQAAFQLSTALSAVRENPNAVVMDVAVPGQTAHEALYAVGPQTGPPTGAGCTYPSSASDPTAGALQSLVNSESVAFYPILGGFVAKNNGLKPVTQIDAAVSQQPTLATVWLGANDLLKFAFSGSMAGSDSPQQMQADISLAIQKLQTAGARVLVANLPDVLHTAQFFQGSVPPSNAVCQVHNMFYCLVLNGLMKQGVPAAAAQLAATNATNNLQTTYGIDANAYLYEAGAFKAFQQVAAGLQRGNPNVTPVLTPPSATGTGDFLPGALAAQVQGLNDAYNAAIGAAVTAGGASLVDVHTTFTQLYAGSFPGQFISGTCCSLVFGGGILSWDGLHPSDTGYAFLANLFIGTADAKLGLSIPPLSATTVGQINSADPYP